MTHPLSALIAGALPKINVQSSVSSSTAPLSDGWHMTVSKYGLPSLARVDGGTAFVFHDVDVGLRAWASAALEAAPVPDLGEAAAMVLDAMNDGEVWGRAVNAAMPIINADLDQSAWVTVSEVREALVAALRAMIDEARDD